MAECIRCHKQLPWYLEYLCEECMQKPTAKEQHYIDEEESAKRRLGA
jgi:hypothetical protein